MKNNTLPGASQERTSLVHTRSASLPANVKAPFASTHPKTLSASSSPQMSKIPQKPPRKSLGGLTKVPQRSMGALPETDIGSGIAQKNETKPGKRNLHAFDLTKEELQALEKEAKMKESNGQLRVKLPEEKLSKQNGAAENASSGYPAFDEQRSFVVYLPDKAQNDSIRKDASNSDEHLLASPKESSDNKRFVLNVRSKIWTFFSRLLNNLVPMPNVCQKRFDLLLNIYW